MPRQIWCNATNCTSTSTPTTAEPTTSESYVTRVVWTAGFSNASARQRSAASGSRLSFEWSGTHNVYRFSSLTAFEDCDFSGASLIGDQSPVIFDIDASATGTLYFGCAVSVHCSHGQKLAVVVSSHTPTSEPTSAPTPTAEPTVASPTMPTPDPTTLVFVDSTNNCSDAMNVHYYMSAEELEVQPTGFPVDVPGLSLSHLSRSRSAAPSHFTPLSLSL